MAYTHVTWDMRTGTCIAWDTRTAVALPDRAGGSQLPSLSSHAPIGKAELPKSQQRCGCQCYNPDVGGAGRDAAAWG
eukprot:1161969-Pelagomonas_calceolata.AAC.13